mmetsp:Transcript_11973/g.43733  ORF Transcript_11973/g.43733 Transcript_11973/m.43733 type:complete len:107 (-) Transcript_11973:708-1028(-)
MRFNNTKSSLAQLKELDEGQEALIPLTASMYVPGNIATTEKVLVDVGTGYYVEHAPKDASAYCDRKISFLEEQMKNLSDVIDAKKAQLDDAGMQLQQKRAQAEQQQ